MTKKILGNVSLLVGAFLMLLASVWGSITLANGNYRRVLLEALVCVAIADIICIYQFVMRGGLARWIAALITLPSFLIVPDAIRRLSR
ncbi:MAG TPA: hypothetical protein VK976_03555 [Verrucomicrobiae bacterium]|jgi:hypothetical protein|nr:hypothetical protein [Verrucomicrobiae bacterium]